MVATIKHTNTQASPKNVRWYAAASAVSGTAGYSSFNIGPASTDSPTPAGSAASTVSFSAAPAALPAPAVSRRVSAADTVGIRLTDRG